MNELISGLSLAAIFGIMVLYTDYRIDKLRQEIFALRDELFDEAREAKIAFDSQAYVATRALLNGMIRFSHRISFSRFLSYTIIMPNWVFSAVGAQFDQAMNASSGRDREICRAYTRKANELVLSHILTSPLVLLTLAVPVICVILTIFGIQVVKVLGRVCGGQLSRFDSIAYQEGRRAAM